MCKIVFGVIKIIINLGNFIYLCILFFNFKFWLLLNIKVLFKLYIVILIMILKISGYLIDYVVKYFFIIFWFDMCGYLYKIFFL